MKILKKKLIENTGVSADEINLKYKPGYSRAANMLRIQWAMVERNREIMQPFFDNIYTSWKIGELSEFEIMTEYNGFLVEV